MKKSLIASLALATILASGAAMAQTAAPVAGAPDVSVPGHPRVQEIDQRLENQQTRIDNGVKDGQINAKQEMRDENHLAKVQQQLSADEAKNGGHITKAEQTHMNRELNRNSKRIHHQRVKGSVTPASVPAN